MASLQQVKLSIADETTPGTPVATTTLIPLTGLPTIDKVMDRKVDELILGTSMEAGEYSVDSNVGGNIPLMARAVLGFGKLVKAHLGLEATTQQIGGVIKIMYIGAQPSCKMVVTSTTITSNIGALGAETADPGAGTAGFGSAGIATLSGYATLGALVTYLQTFTNYTTVNVMGAAAASTTTPGPIAITSIQALGKFVYIYFKSTTSGVYVHQLQPDLSINERNSVTLLKEITVDNLQYAGCYINELSLSASMKGYVTGSATAVGFTETAAQSASGFTMPASSPLVYQNGTIAFDGKVYTFVKSFSYKSTNNSLSDGYGMGSLDRQYVLKGKFGISGDFQLKLDSTSYAERAKVFTASVVPASLCFIGGGLSVSMSEAMIMELPYVMIDKYDFSNSSGILEAKISYKAFNPAGAYQYDAPLTISIIDINAAAY